MACLQPVKSCWQKIRWPTPDRLVYNLLQCAAHLLTHPQMMNPFAFFYPCFSQKICLLATCICLGSVLHAQQTAPADTTKKIRVELSMSAEYFQRGDAYLQKLKENVRLRQGNTLVYCDTAVLDEAQNKAVLQGDPKFWRAFAESLSNGLASY